LKLWEMSIDVLLATALEGVNTKHFKN
jgi:hypothetical protein